MLSTPAKALAPCIGVSVAVFDAACKLIEHRRSGSVIAFERWPPVEPAQRVYGRDGIGPCARRCREDLTLQASCQASRAVGSTGREGWCVSPHDRGVGQTGRVEGEPPAPRPFGVSPDEAVELCREWMIYLGAVDTIAAHDPARQFCDLYSSRYLAWVDNRRGNLDVDSVESAARLAASDGRQALIFVRGGVRPVAQQRADVLGVAILWYHAVDATLAGASRPGLTVLASGLASG